MIIKNGKNMNINVRLDFNIKGNIIISSHAEKKLKWAQVINTVQYEHLYAAIVLKKIIFSVENAEMI